ncbi:MAG TPA: serine/threonine-protein kinase, partial [Chthoniobacterales bacterium]|nr:serine/threonine-protein kinase [Chthoniobacterales bacterium]
VESLLRAAAGAGQFLEAPALQIAEEKLRGAYAAGDVIGDYEIVSLIGKGGMGEVYVAEDRRLHRRVALKLVRGGLDTESMVRRFEREQQLLAGLNHPNIAQLYASGVTDDGTPYFAMEYVEGTRLDRFVEEHSLGIRERLELFRKICSALVYAHQHLVVHRDIKPANIRVTPEGEPKLLDFGIAKLLDELAEDAPERTLTMQRMLTPEYASPEQIRGERISTASDTYSLGVVLYELLTGSKPYGLTNRRPEEVARAITDQQPTRPSAAVTGNARSAIRNPQLLGGDLDNIVLMALRKEPERRYPSVAAFSDDIRRYLEGLPVHARKDTFAYRACKFVRRNRAGVAAAALILLSLLGGIVATAMQARRAEQQRAQAEEQRALAEKRFNDVRALARSLVFEILPKFSNTNIEARELASKRAFEYLEALARDASDDFTLQRELAEAYRALAALNSLARGDYFAYRDGRRKAIAIHERLLQVRPDDPAIQDELARDYQGEAWGSWISGETARALEFHDKMFVLREALFAKYPQNYDYVYRLAHVHLTKGEIYLSMDDPAQARPLFARALGLIESLREHP